MMNQKKYPWSNFHGMNLDWILKTVNDCKTKVNEFAQAIVDFPVLYEKKDDLTNKRKLSPTGDFTGTWFGNTFTKIFGKVDSNTDQIEYLSNQFADGRTGFVIDGGFFEETGIDKNYDGGVF